MISVMVEDIKLYAVAPNDSGGFCICQHMYKYPVSKANQLPV